MITFLAIIGAITLLVIVIMALPEPPNKKIKDKDIDKSLRALYDENKRLKNDNAEKFAMYVDDKIQNKYYYKAFKTIDGKYATFSNEYLLVECRFLDGSKVTYDPNKGLQETIDLFNTHFESKKKH